MTAVHEPPIQDPSPAFRMSCHQAPQCGVHAQPIGTSAQETAGEYICMAHEIMTSSPHAVFTTHNDFQGTSRNDTTGLIPGWTGNAPSGPLLYLN